MLHDPEAGCNYALQEGFMGTEQEDAFTRTPRTHRGIIQACCGL